MFHRQTFHIGTQSLILTKHDFIKLLSYKLMKAELITSNSHNQVSPSMASTSNLLPLLLSLAFLLPCIHCAGAPDAHRCDKLATTNQPIPTDANKMIFDLLKSAPINGFAYPKHHPNIFGLAWCRGDLPEQACSTCLTNAATRLMNLCSNQATSARIVFQDFCYFQIDTVDFLQSEVDGRFIRIMRDAANDQHVKQAQENVVTMFRGMKRNIVKRAKKFQRGQTNFDVEKSVINGMVQCADGLRAQTCEGCLEKLISNLGALCMFSRRCELFMGTCVIQYDAP